LIGDRDGDLSALAGRDFDAAFDFCAYFPRQVEATASRLAGAVGHYTFISSCSVYADHSARGTDESAPVAELSEPGSENLEGDYGALKALCEETAERLLPGHVLSVRAGLIVGPHDPTNRFTYWVTRLADGGRVLAPEPREQPVQLVDARDLAAWMLTMAETGETGVYNAAGPAEELTLGATLETICAAVRPDAELVWAGERFLVDAGVEPWTDLPLWLAPGADPSLAGFLAVDASRSIAAGLRFRPLADTARDTLAWARSGEAAGEKFGAQQAPAGLDRAREGQLLDSWRSARVPPR
jgi:2'-hydroxyisoflavone reductase